MSWKRKKMWIKGLAPRLTLPYSGLVIFSFLLVFGVMYLMVEQALLVSLDNDFAEDVQEVRSVYTRNGLQGLVNYIAKEASDDGPSNVLLQIFNRQKGLINSSDFSKWGVCPLPEKFELNNTGRIYSFGIPKRFETKARAVLFKVGPYYFLKAVALEWDQRLLDSLLKAFAYGLGLTLCIALLSGFVLVKRALAPIKAMDQAAYRIAASKDLSKRVPLSGAGDELDHLGQTFNFMLERLEIFVKELSDLLDNTAHDFKTPLARIRSMAESSLEVREQEELQGIFVQIMEECDRFLSLFNALLDISEARTGMLSLKKSSLNLSEFFTELAVLFQSIAQERGIDLHITPPEKDLIIETDRQKFFQAVANLMDNAVKYSPTGSKVALWATLKHNKLEIFVADSGPGIPEKELDKIFDRFYRLDQSRTKPGRGIGLALTKAYVQAMGGEVCVDSKLGQGTTFCIRLPCIK